MLQTISKLMLFVVVSIFAKEWTPFPILPSSCNNTVLIKFNHYLNPTTGDFLADRPDENNSWDTALQFYKLALSFGEQTQDQKLKKVYLFTLFRFAVFLANNKHQIPDADKCFRQLLKKLPGNPWVPFSPFSHLFTTFLIFF
jgi:hypothetical protein